ncbi:C-type mannose receptor 2-like [Toxotes jaculatrix]|uniref:C-type mannose receptor 2-like n=1 Tax=Toxotes jaculatrix TaxID=941984 RepID=UPI001B3B0457|nr:C-type mannose receptor 2-like [Toxotes jaculatrix]
MQWSLFLLILMGQCSVFTCSMLYEYHFINETKTWDEARSYCRENYTDLATVYDMADMKRLTDSLAKKEKKEAWIGLYNKNDSNKAWHWSLPGVEYNETNWAEGEPNDVDGNTNCVLMTKDYKRNNVACSGSYKFVCYNEKELGEKFYFINMTLSWPKAQKYCRENHTDLVSGLHQLNDSELKNLIQPDAKLWIGLFRNNWMWSDGSNSSFRYWDPELFNDEEHERCAVLSETGKWCADKCGEKKPFFCYKDKVILINESKTWQQALNFCRKHHHDLVSITNLHQQRWVQERAKKANTDHIWLGLRYSCSLDLWFWVSDEFVCYDHWDPKQDPDKCYQSAAMMKRGPHHWLQKADTEEFNFICTLQ